MKAENNSEEQKNEAGEQKEKKHNDNAFLTKESLGAVGTLFSALAFFILLTRSLVFGGIGAAIDSFLLGVFGYAAYVFIPLIFIASISSFFGKQLIKKRGVLFAFLLTLLCILCVVHAGVTLSWDKSGYFSKCFTIAENGVKTCAPAGWIGGLLVGLLLRLVGNVGTFLLLSIVLILLLLLDVRCVAGKSLFSMFSSKQKGLHATRQEENSSTPIDVKAGQNDINSTNSAYAAAQNNQYVENDAQRQNFSEQDFNAMPNTNGYVKYNEYGFSTENVRQRPGVTLSQTSANSTLPTNSGRTTSSFSPFGSGQNFSANKVDNTKSDRDVLYGGDPVESFRNNLIFDPNSKFNRRQTLVNESAATNSAPNNYINNAPYSQQIQQNSAFSQRPTYERSYTDFDPGNGRGVNDGNANDSRTQRDCLSETSVFADEQTLSRNDTTIENNSDLGRRDVNGSVRSIDDSYTRQNSSDFDEIQNQSRDTREIENNLFEMDNRALNSELIDFSTENQREDRRDRDLTLFDDENSSLGARGSENQRNSFMNNERSFVEDDFSSSQNNIFSDRNTDFSREDLSKRDSGNDRVTFDTSSDTNNVVRSTIDRTSRGIENPKSIPDKKPEPPKPRRPFSCAPLEYFDCTETIPESNNIEIDEKKKIILDTLEAFKVPDATIASVTSGPTVTRYNVAVPRNISPKKVVALDQPIAMNLHAANGVNIAPNFEDGTISVEVPNKKRQTVTLGSMLIDDEFINAKPNALMFAMGKNVGNKKVYGDIRKMTHILVAGTSGSGKTAFLHSVIISLIMKYSPADLRLILIDPKRTEFVVYEGLPHLVINEVLSETNKVIQSLNWAIAEMERRYDLFSKKSRAGTYVINIDEYNSNLAEGEEKLPKIVIIADEVAAMMQAAPKEMEARIQNLTQKSRATGIHVILATQRPSTDVITGVIKSNLKTRIALSVASEIDSRVILDETGAQNLLGQGDLLYSTEGMKTPVRLQAPFISSEKAQEVIRFIKENNDCYFDEEAAAFIDKPKSQSDGESAGNNEDETIDEVYIEALKYVIISGSASISLVQRKCSVGYNKAGKIIEWMEEQGYISAFDGAKARKVLITQEQFEDKFGQF